jgi:nucleotide-binding universal stress UspA family protein
MSERILIPLDGSKLGEAAISYINRMIAKLAPEERVEITLFHVITAVRHSIHYQGGAGPISIPYNEEELSNIKGEAKKYLNKVGLGLQQNKQITVICKTSVSENPADEIIKAEKEVNADLVAMSTHGRSGISRFAIGSVADKVMRGGSVPVLMVKASEAKPVVEKDS